MPEEYTTTANGIPVFKVNIGQSNKNLALRVNEVIERKKVDTVTPLLRKAEENEQANEQANEEAANE